MSRPYVLFSILFTSTVLLFVALYPARTVSPGELLEGHRKIDGQCFDCHKAFMGVSTENCLSCHKLKDIGRKNTKGKILRKPKSKSLNHQSLRIKDCGVCHTDHKGRNAKSSIARFNHESLSSMNKKDCLKCHVRPSDSIHSSVSKACGDCHSTKYWSPATFDHRKYFRFDRDHRTSCVTCHVGNNYKKYTCYGCHEHSPRKIRHEHLEEGIRDYQNCRKCHPSGDEHEAERIWRGLKRKGREYRRRDDDGERRRRYRGRRKYERERDHDDDHDDDDD